MSHGSFWRFSAGDFLPPVLAWAGATSWPFRRDFVIVVVSAVMFLPLSLLRSKNRPTSSLAGSDFPPLTRSLAAHRALHAVQI